MEHQLQIKHEQISWNHHNILAMSKIYIRMGLAHQVMKLVVVVDALTTKRGERRQGFLRAIADCCRMERRGIAARERTGRKASLVERKVAENVCVFSDAKVLQRFEKRCLFARCHGCCDECCCCCSCFCRLNEGINKC